MKDFIDPEIEITCFELLNIITADESLGLDEEENGMGWG